MSFMRRIIVTGGAGFIGSNLIRKMCSNSEYYILNIDNLSYAGNLISLKDVEAKSNYEFIKQDICDAEKIETIINNFQPDAIMHLAAESHVDRSIDGPLQFIQTNIIGTYNLLQASLKYFRSLPDAAKEHFRFLHVSTDEVFGSLGPEGSFSETTPYDPRSPYSATKASSDHLAKAWYHTFDLPVLITNCSNNYGPFQFPEKLIPVVILKALNEEPIPVYGKGDNIRDWLFVEDHVNALITVLEKGDVGETYNVGGNNEKTNIEMVKEICYLLDEFKPRLNNSSYSELIRFVADRPGHDKRYAIDASKIKRELGFIPGYGFADGIRKTVEWYLNNTDWCNAVITNKYDLERLGRI